MNWKKEGDSPSGRCVNFSATTGPRVKRDYIGRAIERDRTGFGLVPTSFGEDYWDGDPQLSYGGYVYDGRWLPVAQAIADFYALQPGDRVLEVGCGKGFLLYELLQTVPGLDVAGLDVSQYAVDQAKEQVQPFLCVGDASRIPHEDQSFDLVLCLSTLHLMPVASMLAALRELERVARRDKYVLVESYRTEREKYNFLNWQLWAKCFFSVDDWAFIFACAGYRGDYGFTIYE